MRSTRTAKGGLEHNVETFDQETKTWTIQVGDSAEAWAKSIGKLIAGKYAADTLVLDFSQLRPAGERLKGYGWISSGDSAISTAYVAIANILNGRADSLLTRMDILDIINHLGTILSSRRSAEIALFDYGQPEWEEFAVAKKDWWLYNNSHRQQSNNSLVFKEKPLKADLQKIFDLMLEAGGSEPGFINEVEALRRAPWFKGANPCVEILLGNKSFCNLTETDIAKFKGDTAGLHKAIRLAARANYRQTCVNLQDGILQESWHLNNYFMRLCGVGLTGIAKRPDMNGYDYEYLKRTATGAAIGMAQELDLPSPKNITCVKPSGNASVVLGTASGIHPEHSEKYFRIMQLNKESNTANWLVDNMGFLLEESVWSSTKSDYVVFVPVENPKVGLFKKDMKGIKHLELIKLVQQHWVNAGTNHELCAYKGVNHNTSCTVIIDDKDAIVDYIWEERDFFTAVSFM